MVILSFQVAISFSTYSESETEEKVIKAFKAVSEAERKGGDVSALVKELNSAIELIQRAESARNESLRQKALIKLNNVIEESSEVGELGAAISQRRILITIMALGAEAFITLIACIYAPKAFWMLWVKFKGKRGVKLVKR